MVKKIVHDAYPPIAPPPLQFPGVGAMYGETFEDPDQKGSAVVACKRF
jgi:hypothetical protein